MDGSPHLPETRLGVSLGLYSHLLNRYPPLLLLQREILSPKSAALPVPELELES